MDSSQIDEVSIPITPSPIASQKTKLANVRVSIRRRMKLANSLRMNRLSNSGTSKIEKIQNFNSKTMLQTGKSNPIHNTLEQTEHVVASVTF